MSIWLISVIAVAAMVAGAAAYRLSGRRHNRRVRRRGRFGEWVDGRGEELDSDDDAGIDAWPRRTSGARATHDEIDEIDAYWGDAVPMGFVADDDDDEVSGELAPVPRRAESVQAVSELVDADELLEALSGVMSRRDAAPAAVEAVAAAAAPSEVATPSPAVARRDRISLAEQTVGKAGCRLGAAYLTHLIESNFLPAGTRGSCTAEDLRDALRALRTGQPTRIVEHGAVLQRLGEDHVLYFDPLLRRVDHVQNLFHHVSCVVAKRSLHVVITGGDAEEDAELLAHIGPLVQQFSVPPTQLVVLQEDGTFHNHTEDQAHYVPAHIDAWHVPESFVTQMFTYAQERFDAGEPEAALRTLGPLAGPLWERIVGGVGFDRVLMAQVLNLLGLSNRLIGCLEEAVTCFDSALSLLRDVEAYQHLQVVEVNLGTTLLQHASAANEVEPLRVATRHLQSAVRLDQDCAVAWQVLGEVFLTRHEMERSASMLARAEHAYTQAQRCDPRLDLTEPMATIAKLRELRRSIDSLPPVGGPSRLASRLEAVDEVDEPAARRAASAGRAALAIEPRRVAAHDGA